ncbi:MAG TPA: DUF2252 family protein [Gemmatimonadales bacterium]|nr:DUF2252 family protein [Gemmatimonadales bacterium]
MNIHRSTREYERWLARQLNLVRGDLRLKHQRMKEGVFPFLRATYYRWAMLWPRLCSDLCEGPSVLSVGDLHVENFGTWRDAEGRLVWGINDFDESSWLPAPHDLVRLGTSVIFAIEGGHLSLDRHSALRFLLEGYADSVEAGGRPMVLAEQHRALRAMAIERLIDPRRFWEKLERLKPVRLPPPPGARKALTRQLPPESLTFRLYHRVAGLGSLGRERYVAIAEWGGGKIAREAKALAPSATVWATGQRSEAILYQELVDRAVRCADPFLRAKRRWVVRRLAPDCCRIELSELPRERDETRLLYDMGWETANVHLGTGRRKQLRAVASGGREWLPEAVETMTEAVERDWKEYVRED